jgi:soluble lytic murein transglycosylase-like protein
MKNIINKLVAQVYSQINLIMSGAMIFGFFQFPFLTPEKAASVEKRSEAVSVELTDAFFGAEVSERTAVAIVDEKMDFVASRKAFPASLAVIKKHEKTIKNVAREKGVPEDVAIGVSLLENGGSETAVSKAGALGVFQLMPGTARSLGLKVNKKVDERKDPETNITAGISYLKMNYDRFGDWGLATWAYHAGEGNVAKALKIYAKSTHGINLVGIKDPPAMKAYVEKYGITVHKLLSSSAVKTMTKKLSDDSSGYPYKVMATAKLFKEAKSHSSVIPGTVAER